MEKKKKIESPEKIVKKGYKLYNDLYKSLCDFVKKHQGEKGYIVTQGGVDYDDIYVLVYGYDDEVIEKKVHAIKCDEEDELLILCDDDVHSNYRVEYSDEDIKNEKENWWYAGSNGETLWGHTLMNIAEVIAEYV